jgi:hypothetical protein
MRFTVTNRGLRARRSDISVSVSVLRSAFRYLGRRFATSVSVPASHLAFRCLNQPFGASVSVSAPQYPGTVFCLFALTLTRFAVIPPSYHRQLACNLESRGSSNLPPPPAQHSMPISSSGASRREIPGQDTDAHAAQRDEGQTGAASSKPVSSAPGVSHRGDGQTGATNREPVSTAPGVHHRSRGQTGAASKEPAFTNAPLPGNRPLPSTCNRTARYLTIRAPSPAPGHGRAPP